MGRAEDLFDRLRREGETAIEELIAERETEELFLDFKRSSDDGRGTRLSNTDRNNLAKAISGFGNSEGGVVVWGVDCSRDINGADVAKARVPIANIKRYRSWLEGAVSGCTVPPHTGVENDIIPTSGGEDGYVLTYVPHSNAAPHQVVGRLQYFIRAGSSFVPTPHMVLAGMFGRRPQPQVHHNYTVTPAQIESDVIRFQVGVVIRNQGPGIASDLFVNILILDVPGTRCELQWEYTDLKNWSGVWSFGRHLSLISTVGYRLPPEAQVQPVILDFSIAPPIEDDMEIKGMVGSSNSVPYRFRLFKPASEIQKVYDRFVVNSRAGKMTHEEDQNISAELLGIEESVIEREENV